MRAVVIENGSLMVKERPEPAPGTGELLVRVQSAGLNGADLLQRAGLYPAPTGWPVDIPGMELAGEVVATGSGVARFCVGDRVMAVVGGGAQAEMAAFHERIAMAVPEQLSRIEAGGFPEAFTVAHDALFTQCGLRPGERLLVSGAAGGVGVAGIQLGVLAGATVVASVRSPLLRAGVQALGATAVDPLEVPVHAPYDVVLELVGAPNLAIDLDSLALGGRVSVIGVGAGSRGEIDLLQLMTRRGACSVLPCAPDRSKKGRSRRALSRARHSPSWRRNASESRSKRCSPSTTWKRRTHASPLGPSSARSSSTSPPKAGDRPLGMTWSPAASSAFSPRNRQEQFMPGIFHQ